MDHAPSRTTSFNFQFVDRKSKAIWPEEGVASRHTLQTFQQSVQCRLTLFMWIYGFWLIYWTGSLGDAHTFTRVSGSLGSSPQRIPSTVTISLCSLQERPSWSGSHIPWAHWCGRPPLWTLVTSAKRCPQSCGHGAEVYDPVDPGDPKQGQLIWPASLSCLVVSLTATPSYVLQQFLY